MKKALVVIDMQNDFISGTLGTKEAEAIVSNVVEKMKKYTNNNDLIVCTQDTHYEDYLKTQEGGNLPVEHCTEGTVGWELCDRVKNQKYENTYIKNTFGSINLANDLKDKGYNEVELIGVCTDICVISNALVIKAVNPEAKITVDASCCAGVTPKSHKNALEAMKVCQINIINEG